MNLTAARCTASRVSDVLVKTLSLHGVDRAFGVPGESFLALLDALVDCPGIDFVACRHEGAAALAAVADAKLTARPGVVMVSRGPGMSNAALGVHVAQQDATPLIVFVGQVDRPNLGRGAFQEMDYGRMFGAVAKWVTQIDAADRAAETVARAFAVAQSGTPGPVIVALPEDALEDPCATGPVDILGAARALPSAIDLAAAHELLSRAQRPVLVVGGECRSTSFRADLLAFSEAWSLPVALTNKNQDLFPNDHPHWLGHLGFFVSPTVASFMQEADLVLAIGTRLGDTTSQGYTFPRQHPAAQTLVHVYPDADAIGKQFRTKLPIVASAGDFVRGLAGLGATPAPMVDWLARAAAAREGAHGWEPAKTPATDTYGHVLNRIAATMAPDAVVCTDSGNFATWVHRVLRMKSTQRMLASSCGAMGMGVPAAMAAALRWPGRQVLAFCGDGGFLMTGNELATAVSRRLPIKVFISNNNSYGTIRSYQERRFPHRVQGTDLVNPDFAMLARAFGAAGFTVRDASQAPAIVAQALAEPGPAVVEVCCALNHIMAGVTLSMLH